MTRLRRAYLTAALAVTAFGVACTLNPQPLPPMEEATLGDGGVFGQVDAAKSADPEGTWSDAASGMNADADSAAPPVTDAGDDAYDASDASSDADGSPI